MPAISFSVPLKSEVESFDWLPPWVQPASSGSCNWHGCRGFVQDGDDLSGGGIDHLDRGACIILDIDTVDEMAGFGLRLHATGPFSCAFRYCNAVAMAADASGGPDLRTSRR